MKLTSALTLSAVAVALMISGAQTVRAADTAADVKAGVTATAPTPAHEKAAVDAKETVKHKKHKAHKSTKKTEKKVEAKTDAAATTETPASGQ